MSPRQILGLVLMLGPLACATDGSTTGCVGGCAGEMPFPYEDAGITPTRRALRLRVTESGFESVAAGFPSILATACEGDPEDPEAICVMSPENPSRAKFFVGSPCVPEKDQFTIENPISFLPDLEVDIEVRSGPCEGVDYHRSALEMYLDSFEGNVHFNLIQDSTGDGIEVVLGCDDEAGCTDEDYIRLSLDMVVNLQGLGANNSCEVRDDSALEAGMVLRSLRMVLRPRIEPDDSGRPQLVLEPDALDASDVDLEFNYGMWEAAEDPACANGCSFLCTITGGLSSAIEFFLEQELLASFVAGVVTDLVAGDVSESSLEVAGALEVGPMLGTSGRRSTPLHFVVTPDQDSPDVTGFSGEMGLNFDLGVGYWGRPSACVPRVNPPPVTLFEPADPGAMIEAPDPVTGIVGWEPFDVSVHLGELTLIELMYRLFDTGNLCLPVAPGMLEEATDGAIVPNVALIGFVAPGIAALAPPEAPVMLGLAPNHPIHVAFGDGSGEGPDRKSHLQVSWLGLELELYPLMDDVFTRALSFSVDVRVGLSVEPTPGGDVLLMIDELRLDNAFAVYNEIGTDFDPAAVEDLVGTFLPLLLESGSLTEISLDSEALGLPVVPKLRAIRQEGDEGKFLGFYLKICTEGEILDSENALCFEAPEEEDSLGEPEARIASAASPERPGEVILEVLPPESFAGPFEVAFRVDGGPWHSFRKADSDTTDRFTVRHGALRWPGTHRVEVMTRPVDQLRMWSKPSGVAHLVLEPVFGGPAGPARSARPIEAGDEATPPVPRKALGVSAPEGAPGCSGTGGFGWPGVALLVLGRRRRRRGNP